MMRTQIDTLRQSRFSSDSKSALRCKTVRTYGNPIADSRQRVLSTQKNILPKRKEDSLDVFAVDITAETIERDQNTVPFHDQTAQSINFRQRQPDKCIIDSQQREAERESRQFLTDHNQKKIRKSRQPPLTPEQQIYQWEYRAVMKFAEKHRYKLLVDWPVNQKVPKLLIAESPLMYRHYQQYGDVLFFDSYKLISASPRWITAGHFSVNDKGARVLLTGTVIFPSYDVEWMTNMFREYFAINDNRRPKTLVTNCEAGFEQIARWMRSLGVNYLINPHNILRGLARKKKNPVSDKIMEQVRIAMFTRNSIYQYDLVQQLQQHPIVRKSIRSYPSLFDYTVGEDIYLGIRRDNSEELRSYFQFYFVDHLRPSNLLTRTHLVSEKLNSLSQSKTFNEDKLKHIFGDERLEEVRMRLEREPLSRFMENYEQAERSVEITSSNCQQISLVREKGKMSNYLVKQRQCDCRQQQKTGIPCAHLIAVAKLEGKAYTALISQRWLVESNSCEILT